MRKYLFNCIILSSLLLGGCEVVYTDTKVVEVQQYSEDAKKIADSMSNVTKEHAEIMYMQFTGLSEYMKHTNKLNTTAEVWKMFESFQDDYGWNRETYKEYTDAVEAFLLVKGYKTPQSIVDRVQDNTTEMLRSTIIQDMKTLGDAAKLALENKNAKT